MNKMLILGIEGCNERWRDILGYENIYQVSDIGNVRRLLKNKKTRMHRIFIRQKYLSVKLYKNNISTNKDIHRLVLEAFVGKPPTPKSVTRHLDGNPQNNNLDNLRWGTYSENTLDAVKHGTRFQPDSRGSKHGQSKLIEKNIIDIIKLLNEGKTQKEVAKIFGVCRSHISKIKRKIRWKHVWNGYAEREKDKLKCV